MEVKPRLSCAQCKRRKTKCDKSCPCSACRSAGLHCSVVERARLPRGRSSMNSNRSTQLEARVKKIEELLKLVQSSNADVHRTVPEPVQEDIRISKELPAADFWQQLTDEIFGLREIIEDARDSPDQLESSVFSVGAELQPTGSGLLFPSLAYQDPDATVTTSPFDKARLFQIYRARVDSVYKVLHWPTFLKGSEQAQTNRSNASWLALEYAICFMAVCTLSDYEYGEARSVLLKHYQTSTEQAFVHSSLLHDPDLSLLQAFLIYLLGLRTCETRALSWTLLATAVRIGNRLGLGQEDSTKISSFDIQIRRRLWFFIGVLDSHISLDRGTRPMLSLKDFGEPPLNVDDDELMPGQPLPVSSAGFTEMSFSTITHEAMLCQRKLLEPPRADQDAKEHWHHKLGILEAFEHSMRENYLGINLDIATPMEMLMRFAADDMVTTMHLLLRRPPYRQDGHFTPSRDAFDVLGTATQVLVRDAQLKISELAPWAWKNWIKWYALALVLAELCVCPNGRRAEECFVIASEAFERYAPLIADTASGALWRPIVNLMRRVESLRAPTPLNAHLAAPQKSAVASSYYSPNSRAFADAQSQASSSHENTGQYLEHGACSIPVESQASNQLVETTNSSTSDLDPSWVSWDRFLVDCDASLDLFDPTLASG